MRLFKEDLKRVPVFLSGILLLSLGLYMLKIVGLGMGPWGVFHTGLEELTKIPFGWIIQIVGVIILIGSIIFVKVKVGIGTLLNVAIIGPLIYQIGIINTFEPNTIIEKVILFTLGLLMMTFGRSLYISANLGSGPRDGLFVGISRITKINVKYVKPMVEFVALVIGVLLGAKVGVGTMIVIVSSGYLVNFFFVQIGFDPRTKKQSDLLQYFK